MDALSTTRSTITTTASTNSLPFATTTTTTHTAPPSSPSLQSSSSNPEDNTKRSPPPPAVTTTTTTTTQSAKRKEVYEVSATSCSNCGTTKTPLWRRAPNGDTICNACGLYYKARNQFRPPTLKRNSARKDDQAPQNDCGGGAEVGTCPGGGHCNGSGGSESCAGCPAFNQHQVNRQALICVNCRTRNTPLWRRDEAGNTICNACGLYYKLHNMHRPVSMKRTVIKRRKRVVIAETGEEEEVSGGENSRNADEDQHQQHQQNHQPERNPGKRIKGLKAPTKKKEEVPAIEDYILPKRLPPPTTTPSMSPPSTSSISSPTSPPNIVAPRPRLPLPQMDRIYNNHNSNNNNNNNSTSRNEHPPYLPPITSTSSSPPLSHSSSSSTSSSSHQYQQQQQYYHHSHQQHPSHAHHHHQQQQQQGQHRGIDSLLQAAADCERLPPISLPPPQPSSTASLAEFDAVLNRLHHLRSRATSQRDIYALSQLAPSLNELVRRAEASL